MSRAREAIYDVLEVYDSIAPGYSSWRSRPWRIVDVLRGGTVLDLGSGHCANGAYLASKKDVKYLICLDISPSMLREAKSLLSRKGIPLAELVAADAAAIPLRGESIDSVASIAMIHHLPGSEARRVFEEVTRVLKPLGIAVMTSWSRRQLRFVSRTLLINLLRLLRVSGPHDYKVTWRRKGRSYTRRYFLYEAEELKRLAEDVGLKVLSYGYIARSSSLNSYIVLSKVGARGISNKTQPPLDQARSPRPKERGFQ